LRSSRELLVADLQRLLTVETTLAKVMLPKLIQEVEDEELKSALEHHLDETRSHVDKLASAFEQLGEDKAGKEAPGLEGLKQEHDEGIEQISPALRDGFDAGAAIGSEHYEIAIYSSAVLIAESLGEDKVARALGDNLEQEFVALKKLEGIAQRLAREGAQAKTG
jgi:ferritin-like metal-binding protein YciE